jgi:hypothetical protein
VTPIYDQLVAELGDPAVFAAHTRAAWQPWVYDVDKVHDLSQAPVIKSPYKSKQRRKR